MRAERPAQCRCANSLGFDSHYIASRPQKDLHKVPDVGTDVIDEIAWIDELPIEDPEHANHSLQSLT
jgi:hypothetical protein